MSVPSSNRRCILRVVSGAGVIHGVAHTDEGRRARVVARVSSIDILSLRRDTDARKTKSTQLKEDESMRRRERAAERERGDFANCHELLIEHTREESSKVSSKMRDTCCPCPGLCFYHGGQAERHSETAENRTNAKPLRH